MLDVLIGAVVLAAFVAFLVLVPPWLPVTIVMLLIISAVCHVIGRIIRDLFS